MGGAHWPLRSQWQFVVWTRQGLLFLVSFFMDCVLWFSPYEAHQTARYFFATLAIAVLGGFWWLQARRQPYAMRRQHRLEDVLYAVDILAILLACVYGALTHDGAVQDGPMRLALELGLGALLGASVLVAALVVGVDIARERQFIRKALIDVTSPTESPVPLVPLQSESGLPQDDRVLYTEGELAMALSHYEAFHRIEVGSATVEQLQRSSAKIGGWLAAAAGAQSARTGSEGVAQAEVQPSLTKTFSVEVALESWRKMHEWFAEKAEKAANEKVALESWRKMHEWFAEKAEKAATEKAAALQRFDGDAP
jgi:hypothetical protein